MFFSCFFHVFFNAIHMFFHAVQGSEFVIGAEQLTREENNVELTVTCQSGGSQTIAIRGIGTCRKSGYNTV